LADFATYMTGDVYQALVAGSVLRLQIKLAEDWDQAALRTGTERGAACASAGELLAMLFSGRTMGLFGKMEQGQLGSYVLGMLLGAEISAGRQAFAGESVTLVGSQAWVDRYACACEVLQLPCAAGPANAAFSGLRAIGARLAAIK
ncbi:MAG: 2-dehydro-3-deoxygalactonokinase, partial [Betaproteobacteria bacterium AqS2]|nr:2-dehydro-3-deoxygalactonokinase [Betaproteobacteria bacterium AqS2]